MAAFSQGQKQRELDYDGNDTARSCLGTAGPIPALCCCYPRYLASCCALHHFCGFRASLVSFSPFFQPELEEKRLTAPWGHQGVQINGFDIAWKWGQCCRMVLGASGVPWDPPDHDLETGLQKPNSSRFCAGLSLNGCWIMFSWVLFCFSGLARSSSFWERSPLFGNVAQGPPCSWLSGGSCVTWWFCCALFLGTLGFFWGGEPGAVPSCPTHCPHPQPPCPPGWLGSLCSCQICQLMRVCVSAPALPRLPDPPSLCRSLGCRIGIPRGDGDVFGCTKGICDVPAVGFYMFY